LKETSDRAGRTGPSQGENKMKILRTITTALLLLVAASIYVQAEDRPIVRATVPFDFTVGNKTLPAGTYTVSVVRPHDVLKLQDVDGRNAALVNSDHSIMLDGSKNTSLVFQRVGSYYFLTQVWQSGNEVGHELRPGDLNRELVGTEKSTESTTVLVGSDSR
jgi:hypothetical protein